MLISTPYYTTLAPTNNIGCDDQPDTTYGPYNIFCLETRLYPIVYSMFDRDVEIIFNSVHQNNRMEIKLQLIKITTVTTGPIINQDVDISCDQKEVLDTAVSRIVTDNMNYALIDRNELYISSGKSYPQAWFNAVMGYVELPSDYNPFIRPEGIYLTFNPQADFKTAYNDTVRVLLTTMEQYYNDGVVYGAGNIAIDWRLERMDHEEVRAQLFRPTWIDQRFAPHPVEFLQQKLNGDPFIRIKVSDNMVKRHYISHLFNQEGITMIFEGTYIKIPSYNLDDAQTAAALITRAEGIADGKVVTYATTNLNRVSLYIEAANKLLTHSNCTGYQTSDPAKPFIFSCMIDMNMSSVAVLSQLEAMVWREMKEQESKKNYTSVGQLNQQ